MLYGGCAGATVFGDAWEWDGESWKLVLDGGPPRFLHGFAIDPAHGWIAYGGAATAPSGAPPPATGETWLSDASAWHTASGAGPGARDHVTLAFDAARARAVFYGGFLDGAPSSETWEWEGTRWTLALARGSQGNRAYPALVYDTSRRRVLLFGGFDASGPQNDLWEWDGRDWKRIG